MKEVIKAFLIVSFLGIMIPLGKLTVPNGGILLVTVLQTIEYLPEEGLKLNINLDAIMALLTTVSFIFIIMQRKLFNLIGITLQFIWLGHLFRKETLNDIYCIATSSVYLSICLALILELLYNKKTIHSK